MPEKKPVGKIDIFDAPEKETPFEKALKEHPQTKETSEYSSVGPAAMGAEAASIYDKEEKKMQRAREAAVKYNKELEQARGKVEEADKAV